MSIIIIHPTKRPNMIDKATREKIISLIHREVVPALGCTEPIAVSLAVAKATELLGMQPEEINLGLSGNIIKNAMGVGIPGTGMIGLPIATPLEVSLENPNTVSRSSKKSPQKLSKEEKLLSSRFQSISNTCRTLLLTFMLTLRSERKVIRLGRLFRESTRSLSSWKKTMR